MGHKEERKEENSKHEIQNGRNTKEEIRKKEKRRNKGENRKRR